MGKATPSTGTPSPPASPALCFPGMQATPARRTAYDASPTRRDCATCSVHIHMYASMCIYLYTHVDTHMYVCMYIYIYRRMHTFTHVHAVNSTSTRAMNSHTCMHACVCGRAYTVHAVTTYVRMYTYIHVYAHTYMHIRTNRGAARRPQRHRDRIALCRRRLRRRPGRRSARARRPRHARHLRTP